MQEKLIFLLNSIEQNDKFLFCFLVLYLKLSIFCRFIYLYILNSLLKLYLSLQQSIEEYLFVKSKEHVSCLLLISYLLSNLVFFMKNDTPVANSYLFNKAIKIFIKLFFYFFHASLTIRILLFLSFELI